MSERDPVSVLLPTVEWGVACEQLLACLGPEDELLVICDTPSDPVAESDPPDGADVLVAGDPDGCSGKANALAYGMERAENDRFVWTDDDFERDAEWIDRLVAAGEDHGPASAVPVFVGGGWWRLVEAWYGALFAFLMCFRVGNVADTAWGGGVTFTRSELAVDVSTLADELREVLSDDYLLTQRLPGVHPVRSMVTPVQVPGEFERVWNRLVRFVRIVGVNEGWRWSLLSVPMAALGVLFPLTVAPLVTVAFAGVYARLGLRRVNVLFAYPGLLLLPVVALVGRVVTEFEWTGRRYRFAADGRVDVLGQERR
jgi:hypothetical protein